MKKFVSILAVCLLVVCFAFALTACNKNKESVNEYSLSESELKTALSSLQGDFSNNTQTYCNTLKTTTVTDNGTETYEGKAYVINTTTATSSKRAFFWDYVLTAGDGSVMRYLKYNSNEAFYGCLEFEGNGADYTKSIGSTSTVNKDQFVNINNLKDQSKVNEAITKLGNIDNYTLTSIVCKDYKKGDTTYKTEYSFKYDDGALDGTPTAGTMTVVAESGKLTSIAYSENGYTNSTSIGYDFDNPLDDETKYPVNVIKWNQTYPAK